MKHYKYILLSLLTGLFISACNDYDWDTNHETTLSPFAIITGDLVVNMTVNYRDSASHLVGNTYTFSWDKVRSADYSTVFYEVIFYTADESNPVFIGKPENLQTENLLNLTEKDLNVLAEKAAIAQNTTGTIYWKVRASNGINEVFAEERRTITISRPDGYAHYPEQLYVLVDNLATPMRRNTQNEVSFNGEYEAYVYLSNNKFYLADATSNILSRFFTISENNRLDEVFNNPQENAMQTSIVPNRIHRILLNFKTATAQISAINSIELYYSGIGDVWDELTQEHPEIPVWSLFRQVELVNYPAASLDYRYKFRITGTDRNNLESVYFLGPRLSTVPNITASTSADYFQLYPADDSRSNYCYKFSRDHNNQKLKIDVDLQSHTSFFRHYITVVE